MSKYIIFFVLLLSVVGYRFAEAQQTKVPKIGPSSAGARNSDTSRDQALRQVFYRYICVLWNRPTQ